MVGGGGGPGERSRILRDCWEGKEREARAPEAQRGNAVHFLHFIPRTIGAGAQLQRTGPRVRGTGGRGDGVGGHWEGGGLSAYGPKGVGRGAGYIRRRRGSARALVYSGERGVQRGGDAT